MFERELEVPLLLSRETAQVDQDSETTWGKVNPSPPLATGEEGTEEGCTSGTRDEALYQESDVL